MTLILTKLFLFVVIFCFILSFLFYISQLIRFARASSHVNNFNARNKILTVILLQQGYRYHKLQKNFFSNFIADTLNWFLNSKS